MQMAKENDKDKKGIRLRNMWHHNIFLMLDHTAVSNRDTLMRVFYSYHPIHWAAPDTGYKAQSLRD